jgi:RHS repeat-associated protein
LDAAGNRTAKTDDLAGVTSNYTYDKIYELTQVTQGTNTTESYSYDPEGNRLSSLGVPSYTVNSSNELTSDSNASYTYDNNGNTTSKTTSSGTTNYTWDYENRLASVTFPGSGGTVTFKYDPFGRRIEKIAPSGTTIFAYDADNAVETTNQIGAVLSRFAQGQNIDEPLAESTSGGTDYYEADGLGSVTSLTNATGSIAQTYTYDSFGNTTNSTGSLANPFQYTARDLDSEIGIYYYRARYYGPATGRFLSEDPIRFSAGANFYAYVSNSPVQLYDPTGTEGSPSPNDLTEGWNDYRNVGNVFDLIEADQFAKEALTDAAEWARQHNLPGGSLHNGSADAFRHCFWSCTMARYLGEDVAETIANEHEKSGNRNGQPIGEEQMDRANNLVGRTAALSCPKNGKNCWDLCTDLYNQHRLYGLGARPDYFPQQ